MWDQVMQHCYCMVKKWLVCLDAWLMSVGVCCYMVSAYCSIVMTWLMYGESCMLVPVR